MFKARCLLSSWLNAWKILYVLFNSTICFSKFYFNSSWSHFHIFVLVFCQGICSPGLSHRYNWWFYYINVFFRLWFFVSRYFWLLFWIEMREYKNKEINNCRQLYLWSIFSLSFCDNINSVALLALCHTELWTGFCFLRHYENAKEVISYLNSSWYWIPIIYNNPFTEVILMIHSGEKIFLKRVNHEERKFLIERMHHLPLKWNEKYILTIFQHRRNL